MELKYQKKRKSERLLEEDELSNLIAEASTGITTQALQNLTGNLLSKSLKTLVKNREVKVRKTTALSKKQSNIYYMSKKKNSTKAKEMEVMSLAFYFLRDVGLKIGKANITQAGNILATAAVTEEDYSILEFVEINLANHKSKLSALKNVKGTQIVLVLEDATVLKRLEKIDLKGRVAVIKSKKNNEIFLEAIFNNLEVISADFDFNKFLHYKNIDEVERINAGYEQCKILREKNHLKK